MAIPSSDIVGSTDSKALTAHVIIARILRSTPLESYVKIFSQHGSWANHYPQHFICKQHENELLCKSEWEWDASKSEDAGVCGTFNLHLRAALGLN